MAGAHGLGNGVNRRVDAVYAWCSHNAGGRGMKRGCDVTVTPPHLLNSINVARWFRSPLSLVAWNAYLFLVGNPPHHPRRAQGSLSGHFLGS